MDQGGRPIEEMLMYIYLNASFGFFVCDNPECY